MKNSVPDRFNEAWLSEFAPDDYVVFTKFGLNYPARINYVKFYSDKKAIYHLDVVKDGGIIEVYAAEDELKKAK
jgi:hypothetical protein